MTDEQFELCVHQMRENDIAGLKEIYEGYRVFIYSVIYQTIQNKENTEDLTADFFIKIWENADKYTFGGKHKAWLATIARNSAIDFIRKHKKEKLMADMPEEADHKTSKTEENTVSSIMMKEALDKLKNEEREIVNMKIVGDFTFKEIAQILNLPMGTVTWRYQNAMKKIRRCGYE